MNVTKNSRLPNAALQLYSSSGHNGRGYVLLLKIVSRTSMPNAALQLDMQVTMGVAIGGSANRFWYNDHNQICSDPWYAQYEKAHLFFFYLSHFICLFFFDPLLLLPRLKFIQELFR